MPITPSILDQTSPEVAKYPALGRAPDRPYEQSAVFHLVSSIQQTTGVMISFEDYAQIFDGIPELRLPLAFQRHRSALCTQLKSSYDTLYECVGHKHRVMRLVQRRRRTLCGMCALGLSEYVQPIHIDGQLVVTMYFGPFIVREDKRKSKARRRAVALRHNLREDAFEDAAVQVTVVSRKQLPELIDAAASAVKVLESLIEAWHPPILPGPGVWQVSGPRPPLVTRAFRYINEHFSDPPSVQRVAEELGCNPTHLGRTFLDTIGRRINDYWHAVKINRAKSLLASGRYNVSEVGSMVGFDTPSHFTRTFKKFTDAVPSDFLRKRSRPATEKHTSPHGGTAL